MLLEYNK